MHGEGKSDAEPLRDQNGFTAASMRASSACSRVRCVRSRRDGRGSHERVTTVRAARHLSPPKTAARFINPPTTAALDIRSFHLAMRVRALSRQSAVVADMCLDPKIARELRASRSVAFIA
jgi:hypothetical protein